MTTGTMKLQGPAPTVTQTKNESPDGTRPTLYLCGPINGCSDEDARNWREWVKAMWPGHWIDPMARDYRGRELEPGIAEEIVNGDLLDIQKSDAMLVFFDRPSVGTAMEVFYCATTLHKPVFVIDAQPVIPTVKAPPPLSPWLIHHSTSIYRGLNEEVLVDIYRKLAR